LQLNIKQIITYFNKISSLNERLTFLFVYEFSNIDVCTQNIEMKAAVINSFGSSKVFNIADIPVPEISENELLIEVVSGSVNPVDFKQRKGNHKLIFGSDFPIVLGYDVAGTVAKTGKDIHDFQNGDKVCGVLNNKYGGGLGEFAKGTEKCFALLPDNVDITNSAALPLAGLTALQALRDKANLKKDDKILIIGAAGGVGHFATQIASIYEAEITVTSSNRHKKFLEGLANVNFIDYTKTDICKLNQQFHVIFDTVGKYSFLKLKHMLLPGGIYINTLPRPKILAHKFVSLFTKNKKVKTLLMKQNKNDLKLLVSWVSDGKLNIFIDEEFPLSKVGEAHSYMEEGHTEGKILIRYN
jgi:NADPH:quinone reductase-like Zn-dependent oxidoreductase